MAANSYIAAELNKQAFHCPLCGVYANQFWESAVWYRSNRVINVPGLRTATCAHCQQFSVWEGKVMVVPGGGLAPLPHPEMPSKIVADFMEAREIAAKSPRGAAALLRLCIQKLCIELALPGKHIDSDIAALVKKGLPPAVQQALDTVRVTGNEAVHPGELDLRDNPDLAARLFSLVNFIVEKVIAEPKEIASLYDNLPQTKREAIDKRDA